MDRLKRLVFPVSFEQAPSQDIPLIGYLFYCNGLFLQQQLVRDNVLQFDLSNVNKEAGTLQADTSEFRLFIAPLTDKKMQAITSIEELEKYKPYEPVLTNRNADGRFDILPIPVNISMYWPFCNCRVTGKVSKWFHIGSSWKERAVCRARVHICEVDAIRYWIYRIPDNIIARIPEVILNPREVIKFPIPIPDPPPFVRSELRTSIQQPNTNIFKTVSAEQRQMQVAAKLPELSLDIRQTLASGNLNLIRETIVNNYAVFHPWFCYWPWWWPYFYRCTELAVVYTDANGRFDTNVSYRCWGDKPDIYIWVEYMINGAWTTVYHPPIPCYTFWDYNCGTNINIHVTDPRVPGDCCCNCPIPGELVWVRSIGSTSVSHINQSALISQPPPGQTVPYNRIGLTDAGAIGDWFLSTTDGDYKRPFGAGLGFYMGFGSDLPNAGIYYYRWSYKKVAHADLSSVSGTTEQLKNLENKQYDFLYTDSNGSQQVGYNNVKLGPFTVGLEDNLYIIPPFQPTMAPFAVPENSPAWTDNTYNTHTIGFDSASQLENASMPGGDGLYEFKLELFNQAGNLLTNIPKTTFKVSDYNDGGLSTNAPDAYLDGPTATTADAFKMLVRIDNSQCDSEIYTVNVNGLPAAIDCCGFVKYKPGGVEADLELSFMATHPNDFAVFSFAVDKGTCGNVPIAGASGMVIDSASGYTLTSGVYAKHFTPAQLLDNCYSGGTGKAAFAETLHVIAMATDGTFRVSSNDAPCGGPADCVAAFALEP
ncbi:MAG: hypothetical protein ABIN01_25430 [Ferruginibacter sp.]